MLRLQSRDMCGSCLSLSVTLATETSNSGQVTGGPAGDSAVHLFGQVCNATTHTRIHIPRYATPCDLQAVLRQHADALRQAAMSILKSETLTGQELRDIIAQYPPQDPPRGRVS